MFIIFVNLFNFQYFQIDEIEESSIADPFGECADNLVTTSFNENPQNAKEPDDMNYEFMVDDIKLECVSKLFDNGIVLHEQMSNLCCQLNKLLAQYIQYFCWTVGIIIIIPSKCLTRMMNIGILMIIPSTMVLLMTTPPFPLQLLLLLKKTIPMMLMDTIV